jgi:hypothetical protein
MSAWFQTSRTWQCAKLGLHVAMPAVMYAQHVSKAALSLIPEVTFLLLHLCLLLLPHRLPPSPCFAFMGKFLPCTQCGGLHTPPLIYYAQGFWGWFVQPASLWLMDPLHSQMCLWLALSNP